MNSKRVTICDRVSELFEELDQVSKTDQLNIGVFAKNLHEIRKSAQIMENALRLRKKIMINNNLEIDYQKEKTKQYQEGITNGNINKIRNDEDEALPEKVPFEVTIKRNDEIVYKKEAYAGAVSLVESIDDMDDDGSLYGVTQRLTFGHPMASYFAFDQLKKSIEDRASEILFFIKTYFKEDGFIKDSEAKKNLIKMLKKSVD